MELQLSSNDGAGWQVDRRFDEDSSGWASDMKRQVGTVAIAIALGVILIGIGSRSGSVMPMMVVAAILMFGTAAVLTRRTERLLLSVILIEIPLTIDVNFAYQEKYGSLGALAGVNVSLATVALSGLYLLWIIDVVVLRRTGRRFNQPAGTTVSFFAYVALVAVSFVVATNRMLASFELALLLQMALLYIYLLHAVRTWKDVEFVVLMLLIVMVAESTIMVALPVIGHQIAIGPITATVDQFGRVGGTVGPPNAAGAYVSVMIVIAIGVMLSSPKGLLRWISITGIALGGVALILTGSRGAWIGLAIGVLTLGGVAWRRKWLSPAVPLVLGLGVVCCAILLQGVLEKRLFPDDQSAALDRIPLMRIASQMISDHPVLGVGANNFTVVADQYWSNRTWDDWLYVVHNKYLLVASENGLLGLLAFCVFLYSVVRCGFTTWRFQNRLAASLALGLAAGVIDRMIHFNVDIFNDRVSVELLVVIAALVTAIHRTAAETQMRSEIRLAKDQGSRVTPKVTVADIPEPMYGGT